MTKHYRQKSCSIEKHHGLLVLLFVFMIIFPPVQHGQASLGLSSGIVEVNPSGATEYLPVPTVKVVYDENGIYQARDTWEEAFAKDPVDVLARAMLAEENEKLYDVYRKEDVIGAGWVMTNRTRSKNFTYAEGDDALLDIILGGGQFALGGVYRDGKKVAGNAAIVANPEAYSAWFGKDPRGRYWTAYEYAKGILDHKIPDPTYGALYFVDGYYETETKILPYPDGRTRFNVVYGPEGNYSIPEMRHMIAKGINFWIGFIPAQ